MTTEGISNFTKQHEESVVFQMDNLTKTDCYFERMYFLETLAIHVFIV
jgi:hypothetical protein